MRKLVLVVVFLVAAFLVASAAIIGLSQHSAASPPAESQRVAVEPSPVVDLAVSSERSAPPATLVSIDEMIADYAQNQLMADVKYRGKDLEVYGTVIKIRRNEDGRGILTLSNSMGYTKVIAILQYGDEDRAAKLLIGDSVHMLCRGGGLIMDRVAVGDCTLKLEPTPLNLSAFAWPSIGLPKEIGASLASPDLVPAPGKRTEVALRTSGNKQFVSTDADSISTCGILGCAWGIFDEATGKLLLGNGHGSLHAMDMATGGYRDVLVEGKYALVLYRYKGSEYSSVYCFRRESLGERAVAEPCPAQQPQALSPPHVPAPIERRAPDSSPARPEPR